MSLFKDMPDGQQQGHQQRQSSSKQQSLIAAVRTRSGAQPSPQLPRQQQTADRLAEEASTSGAAHSTVQMVLPHNVPL
jgi:hypothetical protein